MEAVFTKDFLLVCMPSVANDPLNLILLQQVSDPGTVVSGVKPHVLWQFPQPVLYLFQDLWNRRYIIDIGWLYMHIHNDIVFTVNCPVFTVVKPIRFSVPGLLAAVRIC